MGVLTSVIREEHLIELLSPFAYDRDLGMWNERSLSTEGIDSETLSFVTFNVWFLHHYFYERLNSLLNIVSRCDADVIALQEVTPEFLDAALEVDWFRKSYLVSDALGETVDPYGVLLLSRLPISRLELHSLPSRMGRKLLVADLIVNGQTTRVATVHLESMREMADDRRDQLEIIQPVLRQADHSLLLGDFNYCPSWPEERESLAPDFRDLWVTLKPDDPGYTVDTELNLMRRKQTQETKRVRFDRIVFREQNACWRPLAVELLGTEPICENQPSVFPSDHFGLSGSFQRDSIAP